MKVVLSRAGGTLAERLVPRLLADGHDVRVPRPPEGRTERRHQPVGVRPADDDPADVVLAVSPDPASVVALAPAGTRLVVVTDCEADATEDALDGGDRPWTLQVIGALHDDLRAAVDSATSLPRNAIVQPVDADEVAERVACLVRAAPAGRVPDFGGPELLPLSAIADGVADGPVPASWPSEWLTPRRLAGTVTYATWCQRSAASDAIERSDEAESTDARRGTAGLVQQG